MGYRMEATIKDFYIDGDDLVIFVKRFNGTAGDGSYKDS
jgi:hypothetical protein